MRPQLVKLALLLVVLSLTALTPAPAASACVCNLFCIQGTHCVLVDCVPTCVSCGACNLDCVAGEHCVFTGNCQPTCVPN
ncbi:MAG TPA: hypothetical protein VGE98_10840 [Thermoanaerobaculia bacterium]